MFGGTGGRTACAAYLIVVCVGRFCVGGGGVFDRGNVMDALNPMIELEHCLFCVFYCSKVLVGVRVVRKKKRFE